MCKLYVPIYNILFKYILILIIILKENKTKMFTCEINRLRDELKEMKRDRCQIELARKILNVSDSQCTVSFKT